MATKIHNSDLTQEIRLGAKSQTSADPTPSEIAEKVIAVMEVNPKLVKNEKCFSFGSVTSGGTTTLLAADTKQDFFITHSRIAYNQSVLADTATSLLTINATIDGVTRFINGVGNITLTAESMVSNVDHIHPLKIDRGTAITFSDSSYTVGLVVRSYAVFGYYSSSGD